MLKQKQKDDEAVEIGKGDIEAVVEEETDSDSDSTSTVSSTTESSSIFPHSASSISYILQPVLIYLQSHPSSIISSSSSYSYYFYYNFIFLQPLLI